MQYKQAVLEYFKEKGEKFLSDYNTFEALNEKNSLALKEWSDNPKDYKVYHKHANLSTAYKTIKRKLKNNL